jgi:hypothetical protein
MNHIAIDRETWRPTALEPNAQDIFAQRVVARLSEGSQALPYDISERLRAARVQALAKRKAAITTLETASNLVQQGPSAALNSGSGQDFGWLSGLGSFLPLLTLIAGLMLIQSFHDNRGAQDVAEVDVALLTDDLPPQAYSDPGFLQYLKHQAEADR